MGALWLVQRDGQKMGPMPSSELKQLVATGNLRPTDQVRKQGMNGFVRAAAVKGLFPKTAHGSQESLAPAPKAPPASTAPCELGRRSLVTCSETPIRGAPSPTDRKDAAVAGTDDSASATNRVSPRTIAAGVKWLSTVTRMQALIAISLLMFVGIGIAVVLASAMRSSTGDSANVPIESAQHSNSEMNSQALSHRGFSVSPGLAESTESYERAAKAGDSAAMVCLAECYQTGRGVAKNVTESARWYERAAATGNAIAMNNLGCCYLIGSGVKKTPTKAVEWYEKSAEVGNRVAMRNLGSCCQRGVGVRRDNSKAVRWFESAANLGDPQSMLFLAHCYERGLGVRRNLQTSTQWYLKGAEAGDPASMHALALRYSRGRGVPIDRRLAKSWSDKSVAAGYKPLNQQARTADVQSAVALLGLLALANRFGGSGMQNFNQSSADGYVPRDEIERHRAFLRQEDEFKQQQAEEARRALESQRADEQRSRLSSPD
jgi:TPR repeat protein